MTMMIMMIMMMMIYIMMIMAQPDLPFTTTNWTLLNYQTTLNNLSLLIRGRV